MKTSSELYEQRRGLMLELLNAIASFLGKERIVFDEFEDCFENDIYAIDENNVYVRNGPIEYYPFRALCLDDALNILYMIEELYHINSK